VLSCIFCYAVFLHFGLVKAFYFNNHSFFSVAIVQMIITGKKKMQKLNKELHKQSFGEI
jgi:hypothetical protein